MTHAQLSVLPLAAALEAAAAARWVVGEAFPSSSTAGVSYHEVMCEVEAGGGSDSSDGGSDVSSGSSDGSSDGGSDGGRQPVAFVLEQCTIEAVR